MKILRIIPSMNPEQGGPCQGIRNSIPELQKLGVVNEVVSFDNPEAEFLADDPFTIHAIGKSKSPWRYNKNLVPWLLAHFNDYDVVVVHALWLYHSYAAIKAIRIFRETHAKSPKVFIMPHGMLDPYFQKAESRRLKALRNEVYWRLFENKVINASDGVLFTCEEELLLARTTFTNYKPKKEINVGYGIQPPPAYKSVMKDAFSAKVQHWNGKPHFLFLSRIHPKKGVDLLIKAYLKLEKKLGEVPQLIIAGPGLEGDFGKEMQLLAAESSNIFFPGMLKGDAKWGAFYSGQIFVLPSHQENFGIAVVEALACAKPVLISNKVNIWREIANGNAGIVKEDNEADTYQLLEDWASSTQERKDGMAEAALNVFNKHFTIAQAAKQFLKGINF